MQRCKMLLKFKFKKENQLQKKEKVFQVQPRNNNSK